VRADGWPLGACAASGDAPVRLQAGGGPRGFVFHDTRRSATTNMSAAGVLDVIARSITGHRTASMHPRYSITQESAQRAALAAVDRLVRAGREA